MLRTMIRWGATTLARVGGSEGELPVQQVEFMGKTSDTLAWTPYGFAASVPPDKLSVLLSILGNSDSTVSLSGSPGEDPEMAGGECALYHPPTGSKVHMRADGSIDLIAGAASIILTAAGGILLTPGGSPVTIAGALVVQGVSTFEDDATFDQDATVTGSSILGATVTSNGKDISDTHTHGVGSYTDNTPGLITGVSGIPI